MKGKKFLKRIFLGKLISLLPKIEDGMTKYNEPVLVSCESTVLKYKVIFAVSQLE